MAFLLSVDSVLQPVRDSNSQSVAPRAAVKNLTSQNQSSRSKKRKSLSLSSQPQRSRAALQDVSNTFASSSSKIDQVSFAQPSSHLCTRHIFSTAMNQQELKGSSIFFHPNILNQLEPNPPNLYPQENQCSSDPIEVLKNALKSAMQVNEVACVKFLDSQGFEKVSKGRVTVNKSYLSSLRTERSIITEAKGKLNRKKYESNSTLGRNLLAFMAILCPKVSQAKMELINSLCRAATFADYKLDELFEKNGESMDDIVARTGAKRNTFGRMVGEAAATLLFLHRQDLELAKSIFSASDKGDDGHLAKASTHFCRRTQKVKTFLMDVEKCSGTSRDTALALKHSFDRMMQGDPDVFDGTGQDAGAGGTGESLKRELIKLSIAKSASLVAYCAIHGIQVTYKNAILSILGDGGLQKRTAVQYLHTVWNLQKHLTRLVFEDRMRQAAEKLDKVIRDEHGRETNKVPLLQEPVDTRWWTVGNAAKFAYWNYEIILEVAIISIESKRGKQFDEALMKVASAAVSLGFELEIKSDIALLVGFANFYLDPHMNWLQKGDSRSGGTPGFHARNMLVRYFLMDFDLRKITEGQESWRALDEFKQFVQTLDDSADVENIAVDIVDPSTGILKEGVKLRQLKMRPIADVQNQKVKIQNLFEEALYHLHTCKHFKPYRQDLLFLGLFGEDAPARILAMKYLSRQIPTELLDTTIECPHQKRRFNLKNFSDFLDWEEIDKSSEKIASDWNKKRNLSTHIIMLSGELELIASETSIWDANAQPQYAALAEKYKDLYSPLASTTQFVESFVKVAGESDNPSRTDTRATHFAIGSNLLREVNEETKQLMLNENELKSKQYIDPDEIKPRGGIFLQVLLRKVKEIDRRMTALLQDPRKAEEFQKIKSSITDNNAGFRHILAKNFIEEGRERRAGRSNIGAPQATRMTGVATTLASKGGFNFKDLNKGRHWDMLGFELLAREQAAPFNSTYTQLKDKLVKIVGKEKLGFLPQYKDRRAWQSAPIAIQSREHSFKEARKNKRAAESAQRALS